MAGDDRVDDDGRDAFDGIGYETVDDIGYDDEGDGAAVARRATAAPSPFPSSSALEPCALVIFGVTGDLAHRKLIPALYDLACHGVLPDAFTIVGVGRRPLDDDVMRDRLMQAIDDHYGQEQADGQACERVLQAPRYVQGGFDDPETYRRLAAVLDELDRRGGTAGNRVFYLATPPSQFPVIVRGLAAGGLARRGAWAGGPAAASPASGPAAEAGRGGPATARAVAATAQGASAADPRGSAGDAPDVPAPREPAPTSPAAPARAERAVVSVRGWTRIVVEKPFGRDLASAAELNAIVREAFDERQVYRIDHYLAKETVQNLLVLRFANTLFEPIWNRRYVDHVQITAAETLGVEHRGTYYEEAGALRDMIKPHLVQLFALVAMEPPVTFDAEAIRDEKVKLLRAVRPIPRDRVDLFAVRGQYVRGVIDGGTVPAYREEPKVSPDSITETYAALKLLVDNWRWQGVPFYLRTGKRLARRVTEIAIQFRKPPVLLFRDAVAGQGGLVPDQLVLRVQPDEGFSLRIESKVPGQEVALQPVYMDYSYGSSLRELPFSAYETVLVDVMQGDMTLFKRRDQVEEAWGIVAPVLEAWSTAPRGKLPIYEAGMWGPEAADALVARDGNAWRRPEWGLEGGSRDGGAP
jgi:glucose-6-phosphate 1-dehydrogenase